MGDKKEDSDTEFWTRADEIIGLANKQCDSSDNGQVSSSLLFAAARFNAFIGASTAQDIEALKADKDKIIAYFSEQYTKMLTENISEYIDNYEKNISEQRKS